MVSSLILHLKREVGFELGVWWVPLYFNLGGGEVLSYAIWERDGNKMFQPVTQDFFLE